MNDLLDINILIEFFCTPHTSGVPIDQVIEQNKNMQARESNMEKNLILNNSMARVSVTRDDKANNINRSSIAKSPVK